MAVKRPIRLPVKTKKREIHFPVKKISRGKGGGRVVQLAPSKPAGRDRKQHRTAAKVKIMKALKPELLKRILKTQEIGPDGKSNIFYDGNIIAFSHRQARNVLTVIVKDEVLRYFDAASGKEITEKELEKRQQPAKR